MSTKFYPSSVRFRFTLSLVQVVAFLCLTKTENADASRIGSCSGKLEGIAASENLFSEDIYEVLTKPGQAYEDRNILVSPLSIHIGLAMLRAGAEGITEEEITKGIRINKSMEEAEVHQSFKNLIMSIEENQSDEDGDGIKIQLANRVFVGQVFPIKSTFLEAVRDNFFADAEQVNFGDMNNAANLMNNWVQKITRNRIKDIVVPAMLSNQTAMILVNAIHFKGKWKFPFNPETTSKKRFKTLAGRQIPVEMMQMDKSRRLKYAKLVELKSSAVALPYASRRYSLIIILPDGEETLPEIEDKLKGGVLSQIPCRLRYTLVDVMMPKLTLESNIDLIASKALENLGMSSMTTELAEFSRLSDEKGLHITNVIHKGFMEINEAGSEAAAASAFVAQARSLDVESGPTVKFIVDRPFIAYIHDSVTKSILFVGRKIT